MAIPKVTHQLQGSILSISPCKDLTFCIDNTFYIAKINQNLKNIVNFQIIKNIEPPHRYSHAFGISPDAAFL